MREVVCIIGANKAQLNAVPNQKPSHLGRSGHRIFRRHHPWKFVKPVKTRVKCALRGCSLMVERQLPQGSRIKPR